MQMQDTKIALLNTITLGISFSNVEQWLKLTLLIVSIVYTVLKIFELKNKNEANK
jgi:hypothetical protein